MARAPENAAPVLPGEVIGGKYRVERVLGVGGMGAVVAARHLQLGQLVALKFVLPEALEDAEVRERFLREARAAVQLKSEHVARVFDVGVLDGAGAEPTAGGVPYMVMEHLEGADLGRLAERGPLPLEDAVAWVMQACDALEEAHALGIVHRDIKPENLFLTRRPNGAPCVKVLDFGISKVEGRDDVRLTATTAVMGSPLYMAPEQMESARAAAPASDLWALGAVLYELVTGQPPFPGDNFTEICAKVLTKAPRPPRELRRELPAELEGVLLRCLEKDPARRFGTAGELAAALAPFAPARTERRAAASGVELALEDTELPAASGRSASHGTATAWQTVAIPLLGRSSQPRTGEPRRKATLFTALAALAAGVAVALALFVVRSPSPASSTSPSSASALPDPAPAASPPAASAPSAAPHGSAATQSEAPPALASAAHLPGEAPAPLAAAPVEGAAASAHAPPPAAGPPAAPSATAWKPKGASLPPPRDDRERIRK